MCDDCEEKQEAEYCHGADFVAEQIRQIESPAVPKFRCHCGVWIIVSHGFRCLYCLEWYCLKCAEIHFGRTRADWALEHAQLAQDLQDVEIYEAQ